MREAGNIKEADAYRLAEAACEPPGPLVRQSVDQWTGGTAEPWIARLVADIVIARDAHRVIECGTYLGGTTLWLYDTLSKLGSDRHLYFVERNPEYYATTMGRLPERGSVHVYGYCGDVLKALDGLSAQFDVAFLDDDHNKAHVRDELGFLLPRMAPKGIILFHDVYGSFDLQDVVREYGGYCLDFPRVSTAGGLGFLQVTP